VTARFSSVLVANRGEIACRVIRAAIAEGLRAVAVYSDADAAAPHVQLANAAVRIGPEAPAESYLSILNLIAAAKAAGAEAVHPGYGFLAESAEFAVACAAAGLVFVGPTPAAIRAMGDKGAAKALMKAAGVPCARGYEGEDQSASRFAKEAERIGYPVMVKASAGGGGRGMRVVFKPQELEPALRSARAEAESAFGDGRLLIERAFVGARHIEVQVFGDEQGTIVHLGERDCSIQRRHQKLIEESPSPAVSLELRAALGAAAVRAAAAIAYLGAGTVEFLLDQTPLEDVRPSGRPMDCRFYFLEMNTRIQVEHPVTELVTGLDLVRLQFRVAQGRPLPFAQGDVALSGHAIEARLCAEDPAADFLPSAGRIVAWRASESEGVRLDSGVEQGSAISPRYDSLLAKLIAWGETREEARLRLVRALQRTFVAGVTTNRDWLASALESPEFAAGRATTAFNAPAPQASSERAFALAALLFVERGRPLKPTAAWRESPLKLFVNGVERKAAVRRDGAEWIATVDGRPTRMRLVSRSENEARVLIDGVVRRAPYARAGDELWLDFDGACVKFVDLTYAPPRPVEEPAGGAVRSPVGGVVVAVDAKAGDSVKRGQALATVESMKMHYPILSPIAGVVVEAHAVIGGQALANAILFAVRPHEESQ